MTGFESSLCLIWARSNAQTPREISRGLMGYYYALVDNGITATEEDEPIQATIDFLLDITAILREQEQN